VLLLAPPGFSFLGVLFMCLGGIAGGRPGALKPSVSLAGIYVGMFVVICVAFVLLADASTSPVYRRTAIPAWAKALFAAGVTAYLAVELRRFRVRRTSDTG
jgi:hypothetical protein